MPPNYFVIIFVKRKTVTNPIKIAIVRKLILTPLLATILFATSCIENTEKPTNDSHKTDGTVTSELNIPSDFEWCMTKNVETDLSAPHDAKVFLSLTEASVPFASFIVSTDSDPAALSLPTHADNLYLRYETEDGLSSPVKIAIAGNAVSYRIPADSKPYVATATNQKSKPDFNDPAWNDPYAQVTGGVIYYPASGWGTLLFEDMWPACGDYDFNDLVVNYKIQLYMNNKNKVDQMVIGIRMKAVGGSLPNDLYLRMLGVRGGQISYVEQYNSANVREDAAMEQLNPGNSVKDAALFRFSGLRRNIHNIAGAKYVNTEPGYEIPENQLAEISYYVEFRNSISIEDVAFDRFDFFIAREEGQALKEIHLGGYEPTSSGKALYDRYSNHSNTDQGRGYYYANNGLVWALNIPDYIPHVYENVDFIKAYPRFATWAQSGGQLSKDWYTNASGNRNKEFLIE